MKSARPAETNFNFLPVVLGLAFVIRFLYWKASQQSPFYAPLLLDARYYDGWARQIAVGHPPEGVFYGLPLYPFFLGLIYYLSAGSFVAAKWIQIILGVATVGMIYQIGSKLFDKRAGLISSFLAAIYGPLFFHEAILIPEAIGVPLYALGFLMILCLWERPGNGRALLAGLVCGLAALTKAGILLFTVLFMAYWIWKKRSVKTIALFIATTYLTLLPVTLHNLIEGKDFVFLTAHSGFNFYVGNNPNAEGTFNSPPGIGSNVEAQRTDSKLAAEREMGRELKPSEVSRFWSEKAWDFIRSEPFKFLSLCVRKFILFFDSRELSDVDDYHFGRHFNVVLKWPWPSFGLLSILLFAGAVPLWRSAQKEITTIWMISYLLGMMAFFVNARYRLPMLSVFIPISGASLVGLWDAYRQRQAKHIILLSLLGLMGLFISQVHLVGTDPSRDFVNAGDARALQNDFRSAQSLYEEALRQNPENPKAQLAIGLNLARLGRGHESQAYYLKTLELEPGNYQAHNNLGLWYAENGDSQAALQHFTQALSANPGSYQAHNNLGMLYGKKGDWEAATKEFEEAMRLNPKGARAYMNLGLIRYQQGDKAQAKSLWEKALVLDPGFEDAKRALGLLSQAVST